MKYRVKRSLLLAGTTYRKDDKVDSGDYSPGRLSSYIRLGLLEPIAPKPKPKPKPAVAIDDVLETEEDA
jgi:hypothetical protein